MLRHAIAIVGLALLCGAWALWQRWHARRCPRRQRHGGCGACGCSGRAEVALGDEPPSTDR